MHSPHAALPNYLDDKRRGEQYLVIDYFFFQAEDGIRDYKVTGVQTCALPIYLVADHYRLAKEAYAKDPRGMQRPEYDRALEGVLASKRILLPANRLVERSEEHTSE